MKKEKTLQIRVDEKLYNELKEIATKRRTTQSNLIRKILIKFTVESKIGVSNNEKLR